jgi:hypothetical protein
VTPELVGDLLHGVLPFAVLVFSSYIRQAA